MPTERQLLIRPWSPQAIIFKKDILIINRQEQVQAVSILVNLNSTLVKGWSNEPIGSRTFCRRSALGQGPEGKSSESGYKR